MLPRTLLVLALALGLGTGCGEEAVVSPDPVDIESVSGSSSGWMEWTQYFEFTSFADCLNEGQGELVNGYGDIHFKVNIVETPSGNLLYKRAATWSDDFTVVGLTTGDTYSVADPSHAQTIWHVGPNEVLTIIEHFVMINDATGQTINWPYHSHLTWNANGDLTADVEFLPCRPRPNNPH